MVWVEFIICLAIIVVAGSRLAKYGDLIAEKTGLGRVWIGVVLLAAVTSLPELATGISSVTLVDKPDLTMGDLFGSNLTNLLIVAIIDLVRRRGTSLHYVRTGLVLSTVLSLMLIAAAAIFLFLSQNQLTVRIGGRVGLFSVVLLGMYLMAQYVIFRFEQTKSEGDQLNEALPKVSGAAANRAGGLFAAAALVTVGAGIWLATIGSRISETTGLSASFVGTMFLAFCTSAPEIVVSISAARMGALDMAIGNMVGSNLFNMGFIIFIADIFYAAGPIFQGVDRVHMLTALFAILMSCVVAIGIIYRPRRWLREWVSVDTSLLIILYVGAMTTLYRLS